MKKYILNMIILFGIVLTSSISMAQTEKDKRPWSATTKLTLKDFAIKTRRLESTSAFAQFSVDYKVGGFDFLTKNFNKKVNNCIIKTASWIDTTADVTRLLIYEQTLFDISEIYTRQFRKALTENRMKLLKGSKIAEELNNQSMTAFSKRRIDYDRETKFGTDEAKQNDWEIQVQKELLLLNLFAYGM